MRSHPKDIGHERTTMLPMLRLFGLGCRDGLLLEYCALERGAFPKISCFRQRPQCGPARPLAGRH